MKRAYVLALIVLFPVGITSFVWIEVIRGVASRAIDGSGHFAAAQIYDQTIFPDTFGWTNSYFAGMPLPNFYPPLFFWLVSLVHHTGLVSFNTAFKLGVAIPLLLMPLALWAIAYVHSGRNQRIAIATAIAGASVYALGEIIQPNNGLDMSSTWLDGFYTQPLGFTLMLSWILVYLLPRQDLLRFIGSAILLSLTVLANFFNAITAIIFIAAVLVWDLLEWVRASSPDQHDEHRRNFLSHFLSPWISLGLCAFWIVPMISSYQYLVTRPLVRPLISLMTTPLWCWYFLAAIGTIVWWRHRSGRLGPYLISCVVLFLALLFAGTFAPPWFPLQVFRFFSTLNFLLCIPVGISLAYLTDLYLKRRESWVSKPHTAYGSAGQLVLVLLSASILIGFGVVMSRKKLTKAIAFYTPETFDRISGALEFGKMHNDGRYLVEVLPSFADSGLVRSDSLALNAYLGSQGNEVVSIVYREASSNSSFFNAELNALSAYQENFGISSALLADLDFVNQPLAQHIKRLQFIGVRYVIIGTPEMKNRFSRESEVTARHDIGEWTIFEIRQPAAPVRMLQYRPALLVSDFTVKMRRNGQYDFIRLAEEEFNDAWFDVLLVRSPEKRIDLLSQLDQFGALVLDRYEFQDEEKAFQQLKAFAQSRPLILLSSNAPLFSRIKSAAHEFPHATFIERDRQDSGDWIDEPEPSKHYDNGPIRNTWKAIRTALDESKIKVSPSELQSRVDQNRFEVSANGESVPVLIAYTFFPKWVRADDKPLYAATPFFTLGFFDKATQVNFQRTKYDRLAIWCSALTLGSLLILGGGYLVRRRRLQS